jgi:hypothetical protein
MDVPLRFEIPLVETLQERESNEEGEDEITILRQSRGYYDCWPLKGA